MIRLRVAHRFQQDLQSLAARSVRTQILDTLRKLLENPHQPGLQVRRTHENLNVWYCRVNQDWRMLFEWEDNKPVPLRVVSHKVFDHLTAPQLGERKLFELALFEEEGEPDDQVFTPPAAWSTPTAAADYPFRAFTRHQLRLLGVPSGLAKALQNAPSLEDALEMPGLPPTVRLTLEALATDPREPLADPFRVFKQATLDELEALSQGKIRDLLLHLAPEQEAFVQRDFSGPLLLRGVAGSGKTTVGIYRAIRLARRGERVLFITHNPILQQATRSLIEAVAGGLLPNLEVMNFREWARQVLGLLDDLPKLGPAEQSSAALAAALEEVRRQLSAPVLDREQDFFAQEIFWVIKGFGLRTLEEYLEAPRYGRKQALTRLSRTAVWRVYEAYQRRLRVAGTMDAGDLGLGMLELLANHPGLVCYDHAIIDEAQDMTPVELQVLRQTVPTGSVLILGDAAQSIHSRGFTWKQVGWDLRGRSHAMRLNYRNTREVVTTAADLAARNVHLKEMQELIPVESVKRAGPRPVVVLTQSSQAAVRFVIEQITVYREQNQIRLRDVAVIAPEAAVAREYAYALESKGIPAETWLSAEDAVNLLEETVKVTTIPLAKGLEFPVVFLVGLSRGSLADSRPRLEDEEALIALERERMKLYVGLTRSGEILYVVVSHLEMSPLVGELNHVDVITGSVA
ncbi:3'-5' exonuclease [Calidithermus chliarophilus]|uniref:3'-5' exonuclease n=1 Tax=Calidithermus chliarophilus TaxID=52023 RepID=UPI00040B6A8E|nr:3'-5' exonuclease [Calidithermus chliarophilus]